MTTGLLWERDLRNSCITKDKKTSIIHVLYMYIVMNINSDTLIIGSLICVGHYYCIQVINKY